MMKLKGKKFTKIKVLNFVFSSQTLDATFDYGYEYIGSSPREVITPLTERVFVSLTQAINSHMGSMCVGPMVR